MSNIYIYIKTPQIGNTNATAHMVEHCVLNRDNLSPEDFYALCDIKAECGLEYTKYDIHKKINVDEFVKEICKPLDKKIFQREASAFKEETKNELFRDTLKKKVETSLYGQIRKQDRKDITRGKINAYHKKHYKRENIVICNEEYKIIENNLKIQKAGKRLLEIKKQFFASIGGEKNRITVLPYIHRKSQVLLYFVEFLYDTNIEYAERRIKGNYNFPTSCMMEMQQYVCIAIPQSIKCNISTGFLNEAKKHFCAVSLDEYARKIEIVNLLCIGQLPTDREIKEFIQSIDIETIRKIIG